MCEPTVQAVRRIDAVDRPERRAKGDSCQPEREGTREAKAEIKMQRGSEMPTGRRTEGIIRESSLMVELRILESGSGAKLA